MTKHYAVIFFLLIVHCISLICAEKDLLRVEEGTIEQALILLLEDVELQHCILALHSASSQEYYEGYSLSCNENNQTLQTGTSLPYRPSQPSSIAPKDFIPDTIVHHNAAFLYSSVLLTSLTIACLIASQSSMTQRKPQPRRRSRDRKHEQKNASRDAVEELSSATTLFNEITLSSL